MINSSRQMGKKKNGKGKVSMDKTTRNNCKKKYEELQIEFYILGMRLDPSKLDWGKQFAHVVENCKGKRRLDLRQVIRGQGLCYWLHSNLNKDGKCDTYNSSLYNNSFWRVGLTVKDYEKHVNKLLVLLNPMDKTFEASSDQTSASTSACTSASTSLSTFTVGPSREQLILEYIELRKKFQRF
ncbi:hypothetical protein ABG067_007874 [Albugo candida]